MKTYYKLDEKNKVIQVQPNKDEGFLETERKVICGQIKQEDGSFINPEIVLTTEELLSKAKQKGEIYTLNNVDYQVPFMKDDADGLMQVDKAFSLGITETVIYFTNGTKMPITATEFQDFAIWFVTKRNSFFTV